MGKKPTAKKQIPFQQVTNALLDNNRPFPPHFLHRFSDIDTGDLNALRVIWLKIDPKRRTNLLGDLEELTETDTLVLFDGVAKMALDDPEASVRAVAIRLLWECDQTNLIPVFSQMMEKDADMVVRASAAAALCLFIYLGEMEMIPTALLRPLEDRLLTLLQRNDDDIVRRRALESLGYSSREEVPLLIQTACDKESTEWLASALFAIARSADMRWEKQVMLMLDHPDEEVRLEAVRAAGQLGLESAREILLGIFAENVENSEDIRAAAIWSLSLIGGEGVENLFNRLSEEAEDDTESDYIDDALENLLFNQDISKFDAFVIDENEGEDGLPTLIDKLEKQSPTPKNKNKKS
jgi:HEAT repeat protein